MSVSYIDGAGVTVERVRAGASKKRSIPGSSPVAPRWSREAFFALRGLARGYLDLRCAMLHDPAQRGATTIAILTARTRSAPALVVSCPSDFHRCFFRAI